MPKVNNINRTNKLYIDNSNTTNPMINGDFSTRTLSVASSFVVNPAVVNGDTIKGTQNYKNVQTGNEYQVSATAPITLNGFVGSRNQIIHVCNPTAYTLTINKSSSGTNNYIASGNLVIPQYGGATFMCNGTSWYLVGKSF